MHEMFGMNMTLIPSIRWYCDMLSLQKKGVEYQRCTIMLHSLRHFKEDAQRFSGLDNYSCFVFERALKRYIRQSNNHKNIEHTFAATEMRREVLKCNKKEGLEKLDGDKTDPEKLWAKSISLARKLHNTNEDVQSHSQKGILVGGRREYILDDQVKESVAVSCFTTTSNVEFTGESCRSIWKANHSYNGMLYREKEDIIIVTPADGEVVVQLEHLFTLCTNGAYESFFKGQVFERVGLHETGYIKVQPSEEQIVGKTDNISRKVMLYPIGDEILVIDYMRRLFPVAFGTVVVPCYPVQNDMVLVKGEGESDIWKARVVSMDLRRKAITGRFFEKDGVLWIPEQASRNENIFFSSILGLANGNWVKEFTEWQEA